MKLTDLIVIFAMVAMSMPANAQMHVSDVVIDLQSGGFSRQDVQVTNTGERTQYIRVTVHEVIDPGTPDETRTAQGGPEALGLLVTPNRFIVEPGHRQTVNITSLNAALARDRVYRVRLSPEVGEVEASQSAVVVLVGYDLLVFARPADARAGLEADIADGTMTLTNTGNTNIVLEGGQVCAGQGTCAEVPTQRLYAGNALRLAVPPGASGTVQLFDGSRRIAVAVP